MGTPSLDSIEPWKPFHKATEFSTKYGYQIFREFVILEGEYQKDPCLNELYQKYLREQKKNSKMRAKEAKRKINSSSNPIRKRESQKPPLTLEEKMGRRKYWCDIVNDPCRFCKDYLIGGNLRQACLQRPSYLKQHRISRKRKHPEEETLQADYLAYNQVH